MLCAKCGATNPSESAYCGGCGSFLVPAPEAAAGGSVPQQGPPMNALAEPNSQPAVASSGEEMPTFHAMQPVPVEEVPTMRPAPAQPTPSASEFMNIAPSTLQNTPGASGPLSSPTPNFSGGAYQAQASASGFSSGAYPPQGTAPGYPSGAYPQQPMPGAYPQQTPLPGYPSGVFPQQPMPGAYPPQTPLPGFPSGAYPQQPPLSDFPSGAYPQQGQPSGAYPQQGQPSGVFPPTMGTFPEGAYPGPYPGQPSQVGWGAYGVPGTPPVAQPSAPSKLINPMPLWAFIASIVVVAALLGILTFFTGSDWAAGAQTAGIVALVVGVLVLIAFGVRAGLGMLVQTNTHRRAQVISSLLLTLLLIAVGAFGLTQQITMHNFQASTLEKQHNWQMAINEYEAAGQSAPSSEDIARTYNEWGEALQTQGQYNNAIIKYDLVYTTYNQAPTGLAKAKSDAISAYQTQAQQAAQQQDYVSATKHYDALLAEPYCQNDHNCQTQYSTADATAYYNLAEQKLHLQPPDYASAKAAFEKLTTSFNSSPESQRAHADYASALWGDGQQLLNTTCSSALSIYQQLSSQFSDTTQGQQAKTALQRPEGVKGTFSSNIPTSPDSPTVSLVQGTSPGMTTDQFYAILEKSPLTIVNSDGSFTFKPVKQGSYYLVWGTFNTSTGAASFYNAQLYPAVVGPLCTLDMGQINESFPKA
jgi:tetratricopeptide (TPR) repeat protein